MLYKHLWRETSRCSTQDHRVRKCRLFLRLFEYKKAFTIMGCHKIQTHTNEYFALSIVSNSDFWYLFVAVNILKIIPVHLFKIIKQAIVPAG